MVSDTGKEPSETVFGGWLRTQEPRAVWLPEEETGPTRCVEAFVSLWNDWRQAGGEGGLEGESK